MNEEKTTQIPENETTTQRQKELNQDVNEVLIQGKLIHKYVTDKAAMLTINTGRATPTPNYPKVVFFGNGKDEAAKYEVGDYVKITGTIQSSKRKPNIKNQMLLSVYGETIGAAETQFEQDFGIPGVYASAVNHFKLAGRIVSIDIPSKGIVRLTVRCVKNGHLSLVKLVHFAKDPAAVIAEHMPGDFVRVNGSIQTTKQEKNGETRFYQSYVASELY